MNKLFFVVSFGQAIRDGHWVELNLKKRNKTLAKQVGIDNPAEFKTIRKLVKNSDIYVCIDPYASDVDGTNTLMSAEDYVTLKTDCENRADDI